MGGGGGGWEEEEKVHGLIFTFFTSGDGSGLTMVHISV